MARRDRYFDFCLRCWLTAAQRPFTMFGAFAGLVIVMLWPA